MTGEAGRECVRCVCINFACTCTYIMCMYIIQSRVYLESLTVGP